MCHLLGVPGHTGDSSRRPWSWPSVTRELPTATSGEVGQGDETEMNALT